MSPYVRRLQELLLRAEISQGTLARSVGISHNHLSQVLSGAKSLFSQEIQNRICVALALSDKDKKELEHLATISKTTFRLRRGARPEEFEIAALFSGESPCTAHTYVTVVKLAMAAYEASIPKFVKSAQLEAP
jgi:transcriptional regulator with XRE-family HTH domain